MDEDWVSAAVAMTAYPCCRHCTHPAGESPWGLDGHPMACLRCEQYQLWVALFGPELADLLERA